jgi:hypothetical protein
MSFILESGEVVSKSPLNTSTSKQLYSFPKTQRFFKFKQTTCENFYKLPEVRTSRATTLGYGKKFDFTKNDHTGGFHSNLTDFDKKNPHMPAYSIGLGREYYDKVSLILYFRYIMKPIK